MGPLRGRAQPELVNDSAADSETPDPRKASQALRLALRGRPPVPGPANQHHSIGGCERHLAQAVQDQYVLQYQAAVLNAFQEVSSALISRQQLAQARAVAAYQEATRIALERYRRGQSSYYEVLQEQQLLFPAQSTLAQTQFNQLAAVVQLYHALGGGWQLAAPIAPQNDFGTPFSLLSPFSALLPPLSSSQRQSEARNTVAEVGRDAATTRA
jgi:hypothetical protein